MEAAAESIPSPSPSLPLRIQGLSKNFGELKALQGVALEVNSSECLGLLGPNGAGKSTLLRCIVGRVIVNSGEISIFDAPAGSVAARRHFGWVPQDLALYGRLSCRENLETFGRYQGLSGKELQESIAWCLEWAALAERQSALVKDLSGGMRRRLNMAAGLIHRPRLVLMDEPTTGVDPQSRNRIFEMIEELRAQGISIIYTTHYMEEAERLCSRVAIIDHGHIIAEGSPEELIRKAFGSRIEALVRVKRDSDRAQQWVSQRGGRYADDAAQFTIDNASGIASLLDSIAAAGLELDDVSIRRPNLESVFLHLTGKGLRE